MLIKENFTPMIAILGFLFFSSHSWSACDGDNPCTDPGTGGPCDVWNCEDCSYDFVPACDTDGDGVADSCYMCDTDGDGEADHCYTCDSDGDGVLDSCFLCDEDHDGYADACYKCDTDNDGKVDSCFICDTDNDGFVDSCYPCDTDGNGYNDSCYNCDSDGDGVMDSCTAIPQLDDEGNAMDPCAAAVNLGLDGGHQGGIVCEDGVQTPCVWQQNLPYPGIDSSDVTDCFAEHESFHMNCHSPSCLNDCGWGTGSHPSGEDDRNECDAWGETLRCLEVRLDADPMLGLDPNFMEAASMAETMEAQCADSGFGTEFDTPGCYN